MGKGGYNGGSTIIHPWPSKTAKLSETELTNNKNYLCKICQKKFFGDSYFDHLREHSLEGCYSCGEPYNPNELQEKDMRICSIWRICLKCGKKTLIRESTKANKNTKELHSRTDTASPPHIKDRRKHRNKFKVYFGDILQEAINKKKDNAQ